MAQDRNGHGSAISSLGFFLAVGMIVGALLLGRSFEKARSGAQTITVKGYAERRITSDVAAWSGSVSANGTQLTLAYAQIERSLELTLAWLEENGVERGDVAVAPVQTDPQYRFTDKGMRTGEILGYNLMQRISLESDDVALVQKLARESGALIKKGVDFRSWEPSFFFSKIDDLKIEMLGAATRNARERAEQLAVNSGSEVGSLRSASQGVFQITPVNSTMVSDYGTYDTRTVEKVVKAVVTVKYAID